MVKSFGRRAKLVFKEGGGNGDATLHVALTEGRVFGQVEGAIEKQVASVGDGGGESRLGEVGGENGFKRVDGRESGEAGGQHDAGLVASSADDGFVLGQYRSGEDGGEHLAVVFALSEDLVAETSVLNLEGHRLAQAKTQNGRAGPE